MGLSLGKICSLADWVGLIQSIQPEEADDPDLKKASYYLHTIATIPSEQGKRLGRDLISRMENIAHRQGEKMGLAAIPRSNVRRTCLFLYHSSLGSGGPCLPQSRLQHFEGDKNPFC